MSSVLLWKCKQNARKKTALIYKQMAEIKLQIIVFLCTRERTET